jgi:hypothetical protein
LAQWELSGQIGSLVYVFRCSEEPTRWGDLPVGRVWEVSVDSGKVRCLGGHLRLGLVVRVD